MALTVGKQVRYRTTSLVRTSNSTMLSLRRSNSTSVPAPIPTASRMSYGMVI